MKIECVKEKLKDAILKTERIISKNNTLPVLGCVLLSAKNNSLSFRSTNLDIGIEITIPAKVIEEGVIAIPRGTLSHVLSNSNVKKIILSEKQGNLYIETEYNKTLIKTVPHEDFPTIPKITKGVSFSVDSKKCIQGISDVVYSASFSDIKPELSSVYIYPQNGNLVFVSTDSFRLAEKKVDIVSLPDFDGVILPYKNALEISRIFEGLEGFIDVVSTNNQIAFSLENIYITSRIIEGTFPDYRSLIPKEFKTEVILFKEDLLNALKMNHMFSDTYNQTTISIDPAQKEFILESRNNDIGENKAALESVIKGETTEIKCNYKYILDCLQSIHSDSVSLLFNGNEKPITIKGVGDSSFVYLMMPMNK